MKYVVYERSYENGYFYYVSEAEVDKNASDFPRNVLDTIGIRNHIIGPVTTSLNPGILVGYLLDGYDKEVYVFEEDDVPGYVTENLDSPQKILLYKVDTDELTSIGHCGSFDVAQQIKTVVDTTFNALNIKEKMKCFYIHVDNKKPFRLVEVFNLMAPNEIKVTNVMHFDNLRDAKNKKAEIEYETSKYPGTDVNSYFVIGG